MENESETGDTLDLKGKVHVYSGWGYLWYVTCQDIPKMTFLKGYLPPWHLFAYSNEPFPESSHWWSK